MNIADPIGSGSTTLIIFKAEYKPDYTEESQRRAVVFYLDKGSGFLGKKLSEGPDIRPTDILLDQTSDKGQIRIMNGISGFLLDNWLDICATVH